MLETAWSFMKFPTLLQMIVWSKFRIKTCTSQNNCVLAKIAFRVSKCSFRFLNVNVLSWHQKWSLEQTDWWKVKLDFCKDPFNSKKLSDHDFSTGTIFSALSHVCWKWYETEAYQTEATNKFRDNCFIINSVMDLNKIYRNQILCIYKIAVNGVNNYQNTLKTYVPVDMSRVSWGQSEISLPYFRGEKSTLAFEDKNMQATLLADA